MKLYAESSAVVAWLLGEPDAPAIAELLESAELVLCSELTIMECERVLVRLLVDGRIDSTQEANRRSRLNEVSRHWLRMRIESPVLVRAGRRFPIEPIRSLDALHLASAIRLSNSLPDLILLSLDKRIRENAIALGFDLLPRDGAGMWHGRGIAG